ncbi:unnamed protein product, partial [Prorocentrum cordatum]
EMGSFDDYPDFEWKGRGVAGKGKDQKEEHSSARTLHCGGLQASVSLEIEGGGLAAIAGLVGQKLGPSPRQTQKVEGSVSQVGRGVASVARQFQEWREIAMPGLGAP